MHLRENGTQGCGKTVLKIAGVVLHIGPATYLIGDRIVAAPISTLWAGKMAAPFTEEHLKESAQAGSESDFYNVLSKVPATDPLQKDAM